MKCLLAISLSTLVIGGYSAYAANVPFGGLCEPDSDYGCGGTGGGIYGWGMTEMLIVVIAIGLIWKYIKIEFPNSLLKRDHEIQDEHAKPSSPSNHLEAYKENNNSKDSIFHCGKCWRQHSTSEKKHLP